MAPEKKKIVHFFFVLFIFFSTREKTWKINWLCTTDLLKKVVKISSELVNRILMFVLGCNKT